MENKQTGWVPDFPDVKDYTLKSKQVRKALQPIQATQIIGSLESQKESVLELLDEIVKTTKDNKPKVEELYQKLQKGRENEVCLVEAELLESNEQIQIRTEEDQKIGELLDIERIPSKLFDIIVEKYFKKSSSNSDLVKFLKDEQGHRLIKAVYPIVKIIAQILTPIGEHGNLLKAVTDKGIKYFKILLEKQSNTSLEKQLSNSLEKQLGTSLEQKLESLFQEIKELKKATERNHNFPNSSLQSISSWKSNHKYFEYLACSAILKAKEELIAIEASLNTKPDEKIKNILDTVKEDLNTDFVNALKEKKLPFTKALDFDGKACIETKSFELKKSQVTVEFWAKVDKDDVSQNDQNGLAFSVGSDTQIDSWQDVFQVVLCKNNLCLYWCYGTWQSGGSLVADYSPYLDKWTHIALVSQGKNGDFMGIYLNGELVAESHNSDGADELHQLKIGYLWKGEIANFYIWNQVLDKQEIRSNMFLKLNERKKPTPYWSLDELTYHQQGDTDNCIKPQIIDNDKSSKWVIEKNFDGLVTKDQTRFNIRLEQKENDFSEEDVKTNRLQFLILRKNLEKIITNTPKDADNAKNSLVGLAILPDFIDLSLWCSEIEDQGSLNSCTASAAIALMEYFQKKSFGKYIDGSRLFLYKATRNLMQIEGNVGTSIRNTMKAMALFGVPPEEYWPYDEAKVNVEPNPFCYAFAQSYQALKYFRLDPAGITNKVLLAQIKAILVSGFPCVFGFTLYSSIYDESNPRGHIPYPHQRDKAEGGHSVVAVGYDDYKVIKNADDEETEGALLIRNSWGSRWGEGGYGWLPYEYILKGLTADWWSLLSSEWFDTEQFGLGGKDWTDNVGINKQNQDPTKK